MSSQAWFDYWEGCEVLNGWNFGSEPYLVTIGNNVCITVGVSIAAHNGGVWVLRHLYPELSDADKFERVAIGDNCHISMGTTIMPGVVIGKNCVIGTGAIVTKDVPDDSVAVGVPARVICAVEEYCSKHENEFINMKYMSWDEKRRFAEDMLPISDR